MKKKLMMFLLSLSMIVTAIPMNGNVYANDSGITTYAYNNGVFTYDWGVNDSQITITGLVSGQSVTDLDIPESIDGKFVTKIGDNAFKDNTSIASVTLPDTIQEIGAWAFSGTSITSLTTGSRCRHIGERAFYNCTQLQSVTINSENDITIDTLAFCADRAIQSLNVKAKRMICGDNAFQNCSSMVFQTLPGTLNASSGVFVGCSKLMDEHDTLPFTTGSLNNAQFNMASWDKIVVNESTTSLADYAYYNNDASVIVIPDSVTNISANAFFHNNGNTIDTIVYTDNQVAKDYTYPERNVTFKPYAEADRDPYVQTSDLVFDLNNEDTKSFTFDLGGGNNAATGVSKVLFDSTEVNFAVAGNTITIAKSDVMSLAGKTYKVTVVFNNNKTATGVVMRLDNGITDPSAFVFYPITSDGLRIMNLTEYGKSLSKIVLPDIIDGYKVVKIESLSFVGSNVSSIELNDNMLIIGNNAFENTNLSSIEINDSLTSINYEAFKNCKLTKIFLPDACAFIGQNAFYGNNSLKQIYIPDNADNPSTNSVTTALKNTGSSKLATTVYTNNTFWQSWDWSGKENRTVTFKPYERDIFVTSESMMGSAKVTAISGLTKYGRKLTSITIPSTINGLPVVINRGAFANNTTLQSVAISNGVKGTLALTFDGCSNLTSVTLPNSIATIGEGAFRNCVSLQNITIPENITSISQNAFYGCDTLTDISILDGVTSITTNAFATSGVTLDTIVRTDNTYVRSYNWTGDHRNVTFKRVTPLVQPVGTKASKVFYKNQPANIEYTLTLNDATAVEGVAISGKTIDYTYANDTLTLDLISLMQLKPGTHDVKVTCTIEDGSAVVENVFTLLVIDPNQSGSGSSDDNPEAVDTKTYQFFKDHQRDVMIPIKMNNANTLENLYLGDVKIDPSNYSFKKDTIIISSAYLASLNTGVYRLLPTFDGNRFINNLVLEVYEKYDDRLLPYLLTSYIKYDHADVHMTVDLGVGDTKATDVKMLIIDNKYVMPSGSTSPYEPSTSLASVRSNKNPANFAFYLDGTDLVLTSSFIDSMNFASGSTHLIGCVFENSEETASLKRVTLQMPTESGDNNNSGGSTGGNGDSGNNGGGSSGSSGSGGSGGSGSGAGGGAISGGGTTEDVKETVIDPITKKDGEDVSIKIPSTDPINNAEITVNGDKLDDKDYTVKDNEIKFTESGKDKLKPGINKIMIRTHNHVYSTFVTIESANYTIALHDKTYKGGKLQFKLPSYNGSDVFVRVNGKTIAANRYTVSGSGIVTLKRAAIKRLLNGANGITISTKDKDYVVFVNVNRQKIELYAPYLTAAKTMTRGSKYQIRISGAYKVTYRSLNKKIASVSDTGLITAKKKGTARIKVLAKNKSGKIYKTMLTIRVRGGKVTLQTVKANASKSMILTLDMTAKRNSYVTMKMKNAGKRIYYTSSNRRVATVSKDGMIHAIKRGYSVITATIKRNGTAYTYKYYLTVK